MQDKSASLLKLILKRLLHYFFPIFCLVCESTQDTYICKDCFIKLPHRSQTCIVCKRHNPEGITCASCTTKYTPSRFFSLLAYRGNIRKILNTAKYQSLEKVFITLSFKIAPTLPRAIKEADVLCPIPMLKTKERSRGFNHAEAIAKTISKETAIPYKQLLTQIKPSKEQKNLTKEDRKKNVEDIYKTNADVKGKTILLIDDICTTGATLLSACKVLKKAGAKNVQILTITCTS